MFKKKFTKLFTWANFLKLGVFYIVCLFTYNILVFLFSCNFLQLFTLKEIGSADFSFNDLYYRVEEKGNFKHKNFRNPKSVVLVNTGSLDQKLFRIQLSQLLYELENYDPALIALDHFFDNDSTKIGTEELTDAVEYFGNLIVAYDSTVPNNLKLESKPADVFLPRQISHRYYKSSDKTFAFLIAKGMNANLQPLKNVNDSFPINYCSFDIGFVDWRDDVENYLYDINFKAIEASDFLNQTDSLTKAALYDIVKGKALILGHLGMTNMYNKNDIEDKFRVPVDAKAMTSREKIMPGPVVHANAVENYLHPDQMFYEFKGIYYQLFYYAITLLFLAFVLLENMKNVFKKIVLGILSILSVFVVVKLMEYGIYFTMGTTLLQLLIIEEISELFEPYYNKMLIFYKLQKSNNKEISTETSSADISEE